jgi:hypothetical protein
LAKPDRSDSAFGDLPDCDSQIPSSFELASLPVATRFDFPLGSEHGALTYKPATNYNGPDAFTFTVSDGSLYATGIVSLTLTPVNDSPVAVNDSYSMAPNQSPFADTMTVAAAMMGLMPILWSLGTGADMMKRVAAPMVGGLVTSFALELLVYPPIYEMWKRRSLPPSASTP